MTEQSGKLLPGGGGGASLELDTDDEVVSPATKAGDSVAERIGRAAPVEEVDAMLKREVNVNRGKTAIAARPSRQTDRATPVGKRRAVCRWDILLRLVMVIAFW
jgi:hypothetical protein